MGFKKKSVLQAVNCILDDSNVQLVSWVTKKIILYGHEIEFPRLVRREVVERISIMYAEYYPDKHDSIGGTSFKKMQRQSRANIRKQKLQSIMFPVFCCMTTSTCYGKSQ
jgi:hypothetical protein